MSNGEEVIATYMKYNEDSIEIRKGLVLMQGPQGLAFGTFFSTARQDQPINIAKDKLVSVAHINDKIKDEYNKIFSKIKVPPKPSIIT